MNQELSSDREQIVLLGASNLTLSFPLVLNLLQRCFSQPVDIFAAHGHGRSFGIRSQVLMRGLPGIRTCRLWDDLPASESSTYGLITDVGNDLMYGVSVEQITRWVTECLTSLRGRGAQITITQLPLASLQRLGRTRFRVMKRMLFPRAQVTWDDLQAQVEQLADWIVQLAKEYSASLVVPESQWYGFDPIHIRRKHRPHAWSQILGDWSGESDRVTVERPTLPASIRVWRLSPAVREMFGKERSAEQPVHETPQMRLSLY